MHRIGSVLRHCIKCIEYGAGFCMLTTYQGSIVTIQEVFSRRLRMEWNEYNVEYRHYFIS